MAKTFQYKSTISLPRDEFKSAVVRNSDLSKKDIRVLLHLLTHLDGSNFREISKKNISYDLDISKKDVSSSIENLIEEGILSCGSTSSVKDGYILNF